MFLCHTCTSLLLLHCFTNNIPFLDKLLSKIFTFGVLAAAAISSSINSSIMPSITSNRTTKRSPITTTNTHTTTKQSRMIPREVWSSLTAAIDADAPERTLRLLRQYQLSPADGIGSKSAAALAILLEKQKVLQALIDFKEDNQSSSSSSSSSSSPSWIHGPLGYKATALEFACAQKGNNNHAVRMLLAAGAVPTHASLIVAAQVGNTAHMAALIDAVKTAKYHDDDDDNGNPADQDDKDFLQTCTTTITTTTLKFTTEDSKRTVQMPLLHAAIRNRQGNVLQFLLRQYDHHYYCYLRSIPFRTLFLMYLEQQERSSSSSSWRNRDNNNNHNNNNNKENFPTSLSCRDYINTSRDDLGRTALHVAIVTGSLDFVATLIQAGANVNVKTRPTTSTATSTAKTTMTCHDNDDDDLENHDDGWTPLQLAVMWNENHSIARLLIDAGADVLAQATLTGMTALHLFWRHGRHILNTTHRPRHYDDDATTATTSGGDGTDGGGTGYHNGVFGRGDGGKAMIDLLLEAAAMQQQGETGRGDNHDETINNNYDTTKRQQAVSLLLEARDHEGKTPLLWACRQAHAHLVEHFVAVGANIHAQDDWGRTALHYACTGWQARAKNCNGYARAGTPEGPFAFCQALVQLGANPVICDKEGNLPFFELAEHAMDTESVTSSIYSLFQQALHHGLFANRR